ncbi:MAG TPA: alpha/beta family hydrolase [Myxococcales bacterium]|nr:alpha/beta family hydrolase [Myxococcales bacterium]
MKDPVIVFAPGAGAPSRSDWMKGWTHRLGTLGPVVPFDYRYQIERRPRPDPLPALVARHRQAVAEARLHHPGPVVLAGKSMGSRVGCHASLEEPVDALVCFGYPLRAAGSGQLRDEVLLRLRTPILFVQGTRDPLCPLPLLEALRPRMTVRNDLHVVDGGDHSLRVSKKLPQAPVDDDVLAAVASFLASL